MPYDLPRLSEVLVAALTSPKMLQHFRQYLGNRSSYGFEVNGIGIGKKYSARFRLGIEF